MSDSYDPLMRLEKNLLLELKEHDGKVIDDVLRQVYTEVRKMSEECMSDLNDLKYKRTGDETVFGSVPLSRPQSPETEMWELSGALKALQRVQYALERYSSYNRAGFSPAKAPSSITLPSPRLEPPSIRTAGRHGY